MEQSGLRGICSEGKGIGEVHMGQHAGLVRVSSRIYELVQKFFRSREDREGRVAGIGQNCLRDMAEIGLKSSGLLTSGLHNSLAAVTAAAVSKLLTKPSIFFTLYFSMSYSFYFPD